LGLLFLLLPKVRVNFEALRSLDLMEFGQMLVRASLSEVVENHRDHMWRREGDVRVEDALSAERFVNTVGFCNALTDCRRPGPSLFIAVCGRRDARLPRNIQKDPESRLTWTIKDEILERGRVYYAKLLKGHSTFISRKLVPCFHSLLGIPRGKESLLLSPQARDVLTVLREEWEMSTADLRKASGVRERAQFNKAMDELQRTLKVIPTQVVYEPSFTYIWSLAEIRFQEELRTSVNKEEALKEIARAYLTGAGKTFRGELARCTGLSSVDAGLGNWGLVAEGFAVRTGPGIYSLRGLEEG